MYPKRPKSDQELIDYWIKVAGTPGKGCVSVELEAKHIDITPMESKMIESKLAGWEIINSAINVAEVDTGVKGTISRPDEGNQNEEGCNK